MAFILLSLVLSNVIEPATMEKFSVSDAKKGYISNVWHDRVATE